MGRACIGTCSNLAEAALVRAAFDAHDIPVVINAEQHASVLGGLGGAFVPLHIYVDDSYAEEAAALLKDLREHDREADDPEADAGAESEPADGADEEEDDDEAGSARGGVSVDVRVERRRRTVAVLLFPLFGMAHVLTGAPLRGVVLGAIEVFALTWIFGDNPNAGTLLFCAAVVADIAGALRRIYRPKSQLPVARVRR
jgi:hypothetical protein